MATQVTRYDHSIDEMGSVRTASERTGASIDDSLDRPSMWAETARGLIAHHSSHDESVILEGESGSGRKFLASVIHRNSARRNFPFVTVAFAFTPMDVVRRVLFGTDRGPFDENAPGEKGLLELAAGGTLYVDDFPDLTANVTRLIEHPGRRRADNDSVRVLFGSRIPPNGYNFRSSLRSERWDRIQIPPLRERRDDIEPLALHFVKRRCEQLRKETRAISPDVSAALRSYDWPRNVSELRSVVNHLVRQSKPPALDTPLLPTYMLGASESKQLLSSELDLDAEVRQFEMDLICAALRQSRGYQNKAAQLLRLRPTTLFMKIKRYGIEVDDFK